MFRWLNDLRKAKLQVNITLVYPAEGVDRITTPTAVEQDSVNIKRRTQSNFRFIEEHVVDHDGSERTWYKTEHCEDGRWVTIGNSFSRNKEEAMQLHLRLVKEGTTALDRKETKTIIWEGLDVEETETWVGVQLQSFDEQNKHEP